MELIVDGKNVLEPVNLEQNKNEIIRQRASVPSEISFTRFKEKVGIFSADVKGKDLNELVTTLQNTFSDINERETKIYDQLDTVFKTVESIHKGSIEGIIVGLKSAQEAITNAEYAISQIEETLLILKDFKRQLEENTKHLNDIDIIWDITQQLEEDILKLEESLLKKSKLIEDNYNTLKQIRNRLDKIRHLKDVDVMYKDIAEIRKKVECEDRKINGRIDIMNNDIQRIEEKLSSKIVSNGNYMKQLSNVVEDVEILNEKIENIDHLSEIDTIWENVQQNKEKCDKMENEIFQQRALENKVLELKGKIKFQYYILVGVIGVLVLQIVLNVVGII